MPLTLPKNMKKLISASKYLIALFCMLPWASTNLIAEEPLAGQLIEISETEPQRDIATTRSMRGTYSTFGLPKKATRRATNLPPS